jgi:hypothetical protein
MLERSFGPESEARRHPRYPVRRLACYSYEGKRFLTVTINLGLGGMMADISHYLPENEQISLQLVLGRKSIWPRVRTVHCRWRSERSYLSGFQFINLSEQDQTLLKDYLAAVEGSPSPPATS